MTKSNPLLERLRYHVSGSIDRGEGIATAGVPAIPHCLPLANGLLASMAIQCQCPDTGEIGTFLFTGESHRGSGSRVTPVMDVYELFQWMRENGWSQIGHGSPARYIYHTFMDKAKEHNDTLETEAYLNEGPR
jgi:hypothetical protein